MVDERMCSHLTTAYSVTLPALRRLQLCAEVPHSRLELIDALQERDHQRERRRLELQVLAKPNGGTQARKAIRREHRFARGRKGAVFDELAQLRLGEPRAFRELDDRDLVPRVQPQDVVVF